LKAAKAYFVLGKNYVRYDIAADRVDPGYPKTIGDGWSGTIDAGMASDVDAALDLGRGKVYFFSGSSYIRIDAATNTVDAGYPLPIADHWDGLATAGFADGLDAAVDWGDGRALLFKGDRCLTWDIAADTVREGPHAIADHLAGSAACGFDRDLDAVIAWTNGKAYAFQGDSYVRIDLATMQLDGGYPRSIGEGWPTLVDVGFGGGLSTAYLKVSGAAPSGGATGRADDLPDEFFVALRGVCARIGCDPADLLAVMMSESNVSPTAQHTGSKATGLIQFMPATLKGLGWTAGPDAFRQVSAVDQLDYVERYYRPYAKYGLGSAGRLYQATFLPATMPSGSDPGTVVCGKDGPYASAYAANTGLDMDRDGTISVGDLTARTAAKRKGARWDALMARLAAIE
jgi:hypothetical protein